MRMDASICRANLVPVYTASQIAGRVEALAGAIDRKYAGQPLVAICVLKGAFIFFADLVRKLRNPLLEVDFVRLSSYGMNSVSSKHVIFSKDIETDIRDKHVLIVEDIIDSGHTMRFLADQFQARRPRSLAIAALVDKTERREAPIDVEFAGFNIPAGFIVGYGMDYAERYRTLPEICRVEEECIAMPQGGGK